MTCDCTHRVVEHLGLTVRETICEYHASHRTPPEQLGKEYYKKLGVIGDNDKILETAHVREMLEQIVTFDFHGGDEVLEIGCGISPYLEHLLEQGFTYTGLDASTWVCEWLREHYNVETTPAKFEDALFYDSRKFDLILAAHVLEHIVDPVAALKKMAHLVAPDGRIVLLVPEGTDLHNPDHDNFFTVESLTNCIHAAGLCIQIISVAQYVEHERFIYAVVSPQEFPRFAPGVSGPIMTTISEEKLLISLLPDVGTMLEIGTAAGGTAHQLAQAKPGVTVLCVDTFEWWPEMAKDWYKNQLPNMKINEMHIDEFFRRAVTADPLYDLIFVDGDHTFTSCLRDLVYASMMVKPTGYIVAHDYGDPSNSDVTRAVHVFCTSKGWQFLHVCGSLAVLRLRNKP